MKKIVSLFFALIILCFNKAMAINESQQILKDMNIQNRISEIGLKILNSNEIDKRMAFFYSKKDKLIKGEPSLTKRQIVVYGDYIQHAADENEVAALLSREICQCAESYTGPWRGLVSSAQIKAAPKKYEIFFDKRAVDLMVNAGYNPLGLITFINKAFPQKRFDLISSHNLTSKRLANIYEYIYYRYPYYLQNNEYINNESYQNFLLTSIENRKKLEEKVNKNLRKPIKYE